MRALGAPRRARRFRAVALGVVAGLVAFELVMQVLAFVTWQRNDGFAVQGQGEGPRVLCVGDSFTFGLGASGEGSYPHQLELLLAETLPGVSVVNGGRPGQDSAQVLRRLPAQLRTVAPRVVYLLVGYNDRWSHPRPVPAAELDAEPETVATFPLRLRTVDLLGRIVHAVFGSDPGAPVDVAPLLGVWHAPALELEFGAGGRLRVGDRTSRWSGVGAAIRIELEPGVPTAVSWRVEGDELVLEGVDLGPAPLRFARGAASRRGADRVRTALDAGEVTVAEAVLVEALTAAPDDAELLGLRARLAIARGDRGAAEADLAVLRGRAADGETELTALVDALFACGADREAVERACAWLRDRPQSSPLWWTISRHAADDPAHHALILATTDHALAIGDPSDRWRSGLLRLRAGILRRAGESGALVLASSLEAALIDGDKAQVVSWLQDGSLGRADFEAALAAIAPTTAVRARLEEWWAESQEGQAAPAAALAAHVRLARAVCRARGAELVVLTYPADLGDLELGLRAVAASDAIPLIDCEADFDLALRTVAREDLFVADGHCTDRGYARIARLVAIDARARLR